MTRRSSNRAGFDGLSAFWVARRKRSLLLDEDDDEEVDDDALAESVIAEMAMRRWASVGGLKEESRTNSVVGVRDVVDVFGLGDISWFSPCWIVWSISKVRGDAVNCLSEVL